MVAFISLFFFSCKKNEVTTSSSAKLAFTTNTVFFDTVFTSVGSTLRAFLIHNNNNQAVTISSIKLGGGYNSPYKVNIDGTPGTYLTGIKIPANDSIYAFVTVTINPNNNQKKSVLFVEDSLQFITNGNIQYVYLVADGQNAYYYMPNVFPSQGPAYSVLPCGAVWNNDLPHVIYGNLFDTCGTLTIKGTYNSSAPTMIYFHNNANLIISSGAANVASLHVLGTGTSNQVIFQGDRLESAYKTIPGQWGEILLAPGSVNNSISWAVIKNGTTGIEADSNSGGATLKIDHTVIENMSNFGLLAQSATIIGEDVLITECQNICLYLNIGGSYRFNQCTFVDYWNWTSNQNQPPLVYINNWYQDASGNYHKESLDSAYFQNCIIYSDMLTEEIGLDSSQGGTFNYYFTNSLLKTQHSIIMGVHYGNPDSIIVNQDPQFYSINTDVNNGQDDYHINANSSPANHIANIQLNNNFNSKRFNNSNVDLDGNMWSNSVAGAYQN